MWSNKPSGSCVGCAWYEMALRTDSETKRLKAETENRFSPAEIEGTVDASIEIWTAGIKYAVPVHQYVAGLVTSRQIACNFLMDAAQSCPGLTRPYVLGMPLPTKCGMPEERREELRR